MLSWLKRNWTPFALIAIWLVFECLVSWFATCEPTNGSTPTYYQEQEHCTVFSGPIFSLSFFAVVQIDDFLKVYEHELIAGFAVVLAFSTILLWLQSKNDTRILQRAYISIAPLGINPFISDDGSTLREILGHVNFVNVGRLPARDVSIIRPRIIWSDKVLHEVDLESEAFPPMKIVLPPGTKMPLGTGPYSPDRIGNGGYFYIWGKIEYTDGFGEPRFTKFCHRYPCQPFELAPDGSRSIDAKHARYHEYGNDAD